MTDEPAPEAPPPFTEPPTTPPGRKPGSMRPVLVVGVIVAFLAIVLFAVKDNAAADDLKVGDCFDIPTATTVKTVTHHPCTEPHTAEVFHVVEFTGSDMSTPLTFVISSFVDTACGPAFTAYVGADLDSVPDLTTGYFYPSIEGWQSGDRTITCYVTKADEGPITTSLKGSAGP